MSKETEIPEDLGLVVGNDEEAFWWRALEEKEKTIKVLEDQLKYSKFVRDQILKNQPLPEKCTSTLSPEE